MLSFSAGWRLRDPGRLFRASASRKKEPKVITSQCMKFSWYARRLRAMGAREIGRRLADRFQEGDWRRRYFDSHKHPGLVGTNRNFVAGLSRRRADDAPLAARSALLRFADRLLAGEWRTFAVVRRDVAPDVDWHLDPRSGVRAPDEAYAFEIDIKSTARFDTKYVWELSRHHHTTLLAMAYWLTGDDRYARAAAAQVASWIPANSFLRGVQWSSGIEVGMRLIAFCWTRRLLEDWPDVRNHFEDDDHFAQSVFVHQWFLAHRQSHGSSANNHLLYEMAGLFVSTCSMPWHARAAAWRGEAREILEREFPRQVFASGYSRELASDYNGFVLEALLLCLVEGELSGISLGPELWSCARTMLDCLDQIVDCRGHPPRQGDSDDASGLLLDAPDFDRWCDLGRIRAVWFGGSAQEPQSLRAWMLAPLAQPPVRNILPQPHAPIHCDAGLTILRARRGTQREIYCVFDTGPLGYLSIAAHGHADALAVEVRYGGIAVLVDPGTFAYCGPWRDYFRSTAAHNTIELEGISQSTSGGPFLWTRHATSVLRNSDGLAEDADHACAEGEHDGYLRSGFHGRHSRSVTLDRTQARLTIEDEVRVERPARCRMFFHLHPDIGCELSGDNVRLDCGGNAILLELPAALDWRTVRGSEDPVLGWYSPSYGVKLPSTTLIGDVVLDGVTLMKTRLLFPE